MRIDANPKEIVNISLNHAAMKSKKNNLGIVQFDGFIEKMWDEKSQERRKTYRKSFSQRQLELIVEY